MSGSKQRPSGNQPWLGMRLFLVGSIILIATKLDDESHTFARLIIVLLWGMVSFVAMLKESHTYGLGDRVMLFGMILILIISIAAMMIDHHPYSFVSLASIGIAVLMLREVIIDVLRRQESAEEWTGPGN